MLSEELRYFCIFSDPIDVSVKGDESSDQREKLA